jgi:pyridoxal phosphate enzyme (YggS family)
MAGTKNKIADNLAIVRQNIADACARGGRGAGEVTILAVTKSADLEGIKKAYELGLREFGEGRVQQLCERAPELAAWVKERGLEPPPRWHMIGHLQRNKVKAVLEVSNIVHSIDSLRLAEEISGRAQKMARQVDVMLQVNCSQEPQKFGCAVGAAPHLAESITTLKNLRLVGLMTMAEASEEPDHARRTFSLLREIFEELRHDKVGGDALGQLSMGMSQDYQIAVEEGATMVRIGTAIFG